MAYPLARRVVTGPACEPVTLDEMKVHLRVTEDAQDALIQSLIQAAREQVEMRTERALIERTVEAYVDGPPPCFSLPFPPLLAVSKIEAVIEDGTIGDEIDMGSVVVASRKQPAVIHLRSGYSWPADAVGLRVTFTAGFGASPDSVPSVFKQAIKMLAAHYERNREAVIVGTIATELPEGVDALLMPHRITEPV